jgi:hypothetical protein
MATSSPTLEIIRGDDVSLNLHFIDSDGVDVDITNHKVYFTVKRKLSDTDAHALISVDVTNHTFPATGHTVVNLPNANTDDLPEGTYYYDMQLKDQDSLISSTKRGVFNVLEDVTKRIS